MFIDKESNIVFSLDFELDAPSILDFLVFFYKILRLKV